MLFIFMMKPTNDLVELQTNRLQVLAIELTLNELLHHLGLSVGVILHMFQRVLYYLANVHARVHVEEKPPSEDELSKTASFFERRYGRQNKNGMNVF